MIEPPPYSHDVALDLAEQMRFSDLSSSMKRLLVARWVNRGKRASDVPRLSQSERIRFVKICNEEGFELIQWLLMVAEDEERARAGR